MLVLVYILTPKKYSALPAQRPLYTSVSRELIQQLVRQQVYYIFLSFRQGNLITKGHNLLFKEFSICRPLSTTPLANSLEEITGLVRRRVSLWSFVLFLSSRPVLSGYGFHASSKGVLLQHKTNLQDSKSKASLIGGSHGKISSHEIIISVIGPLYFYSQAGL